MIIIKEHEGIINLVNDINKLNKYVNLTKGELYRKLLDKCGEIFDDGLKNRKNDGYVHIAELILISNKLMDGE